MSIYDKNKQNLYLFKCIFYEIQRIDLVPMIIFQSSQLKYNISQYLMKLINYLEFQLFYNMKRSDSIQLKRSTSRIQKQAFVGDKIDVLEPISILEFRKLLPILPPNVNQALPNRIQAFRKSKNYLMLSSKRQTDADKLIAKAYRGLYRFEDVVNYLVEFRGLKKREVQQFITPYAFDGVVDWYRMIRQVYSKSRKKTTKRSLQDLIVYIQRNYRRGKSQGNPLSGSIEPLTQISYKNDFPSLLRKLKKSFTSSVKNLRQTFQAIDKNSNGEIDFEEFQEALNVLGIKLQVSEIKMVFKQFDKNNQGFFRYENFVEFIFGVKQLSSQNGYLNTLPLILQEIKLDLKKSFQTADLFVKDINSKLSRYSLDRQFNVEFLCHYFDQLLGHKYSEHQLRQVYKQIYQSIEYVRGLYNHIIKKPVQKRAQLVALVVPEPRSPVLDPLINIVYFYLQKNPPEKVMMKLSDILLQLRFVASQPIIKTFFYIFKVGNYIRPFLLKKVLGITRLAAKIYTQKTLEEREEIQTRIKQRFDQDLALAGRNFGNAVNYHLGYQLPSSDQQLLGIDPYKMYKILPLFQRLIQTREQEVEKLILKNLALKFRANYKMLATKNKHSKQMAMYVIDYLIQKVMTSPKRKKSLMKNKPVQLEVKKSVKGISALSIRNTTIDISNSDFIQQARKIVVDLVMSLPERRQINKYSPNILKQFIHHKIHNQFKVKNSNTLLAYNQIIGGVAFDQTYLYKCMKSNQQPTKLAIKQPILDFVIYENHLYFFDINANLTIYAAERDTLREITTIKLVQNLDVNNDVYKTTRNQVRFLRMDGDSLLINLSSFDNSIISLNPETYRVKLRFQMTPQSHSLTEHQKNILKKIKSQASQRFPQHPKDFFRDILTNQNIDEASFRNFISKQVPKLFPAEIQQLMQLVQTTEGQVSTMDLERFLQFLQITQKSGQKNLSSYSQLKQQILGYMKSQNLNIMELISEFCDIKKGWIPVQSLQKFIETKLNFPLKQTNNLQDNFQISDNKLTFKEFISFLKEKSELVTRSRIQDDIISVLMKYKRPLQLSRNECYQLIYRYLPQYSHKEIETYLDTIDWSHDKYTFKESRAEDSFSLWYPQKVAVVDFYHLKSYSMFIYSLKNSNNLYISQIDGNGSKILSIIQHSKSRNTPKFTFIQQAHSLVTYSDENIKVWNLYNLLIQAKSVSPPWNITTPSKTILIASKVLSMQYLHSIGVLVCFSSQSIRFISVQSGQEIKRISFKTRELIRAQVCQFPFPTSSPLLGIIFLFDNNKQYEVEQMHIQQLLLNIPYNQTQYKVPIKLKQSLDELGSKTLSKKIKLQDLRRNNTNYIIRSRKIVDSAMKIYFFSAVKDVYIFNKVQKLIKIYKMKNHLNNGITIDLVVLKLKQLLIKHQPSTLLVSKIKGSGSDTIEPFQKQYPYQNSYQETFLNKTDRNTRIKIIEELESLDKEHIDVNTLSEVVHRLEPMIDKQEMEILLQKYQRPFTPLEKYFIPIGLFRNILSGKNTDHHIYRSIDKLIRKAREERPGYYGYQLFGSMEDRVSAPELRIRLKDLGMKESSIDSICGDKSYCIQKQFMDTMKEALNYSEVGQFQQKYNNMPSTSLGLGFDQALETKSQQEKDLKQQQHEPNQKHEQKSPTMEQKVDLAISKNQNNENENVAPIMKSQQNSKINNIKPQQVSNLDLIYTKIANNLGLRDLDEVFYGDDITKQIVQRINSLKSLSEQQLSLFYLNHSKVDSRNYSSAQSQMFLKQFKNNYNRVAEKLREQKLDQLSKQLLEHIIVSINFKTQALTTALKQYWCSDQGYITLNNFSTFVKDIGFATTQSTLEQILNKLNLIDQNKIVNVMAVEDLLASKQYKFQRTVINYFKWINRDLSVLKQIINKQKLLATLKKINGDSRTLTYKQFYRALKLLSKDIFSQTSLKFLTNIIFQGSSNLEYSQLETQLFKLLSLQSDYPRNKQYITYWEFVEIVQEANPFTKIARLISSIQKQLKSTLVSKYLSIMRGISITSFKNLTKSADQQFSNCIGFVPTIEEEIYPLPTYSKQRFIESFQFPFKQIQYVSDQDMDGTGYIVNSKFQGYRDQGLCRRKLGVRNLLSNLHNSDYGYRIGEFYCVQGFNPTYYLPNGAINFNWKLILSFGKRVLEQINKVHNIGYCLTNLRYTHLGKNAIIQQVYYPCKLEQNGKILENIKILEQDGNQSVYIAPELLANQRQTSVKIDSWSFGCLLFEFTFGRLPPPNHTDPNYVWLPQDLITQLLTEQHKQTVQQNCNQKQFIGTRLLLQGLKEIYKYNLNFQKQIEILHQVLRVIDLCLNHNPQHRPSTEQLAKYQIFQDKKQVENQQNEQVFTVTNNLMRNGNLSYKYKYAIHVSQLENTITLDDQVNLLAQSIPMRKIKQIITDPLSRSVLHWLSENQILNLLEIIQKTTNLFSSTRNKYYPEVPVLSVAYDLDESLFSSSINKSKVNKSIQNKWIKFLMNTQFLQCMTYLVCKTGQKQLYECYYKLITQMLKQLRKYESELVFYIDRILTQILKLSFGVSIGFAESQKYLRQLITSSLNQQYIDEFVDPALLSLSSNFDYDLSRQFIRLFEDIIGQDGLPSTQYQPIYEYLITNPQRLKYYDEMNTILQLQVAYNSNGLVAPKSREITMNKMDQIINYISQRDSSALEDSKCHLLFISILNSNDQEVRRKGLKYFQALSGVKQIHTIFSTQQLLLSLFGNLRLQSQKTANKVISLKIFKELIGQKSEQSKRLKGSYYNTFNQILRLGIAPKQRSLQTSTYLQLKPHVDLIISHFKNEPQWCRIIESIQGSHTILQSTG